LIVVYTAMKEVWSSGCICWGPISR